MKNEPFSEKLKCKLDELKEKTLSSLITRDKAYQKLSKEYFVAEQEYYSLAFSKEQKAIIETLLSAKDICQAEYSTLSYLAGLIDGQKLGVLLPPSESNAASNRDAILNFYYNIFQPCADRCDSPDTVTFWKDFHEEERTFAAMLSPEQAAQLEKISSKRLDGVSRSMADSFVHGFQSSAKITRLLLE